ncbi:hypothetical protein ACFFRR_004807 [Megaselia abdita]
MSQKEEESSTTVTLDMIFLKIGQFGKYQKIIYLLICVPMFCNAVFQFGYVFTTSSPIYRCKTACDIEGFSDYNAPYVNFSIPEDLNGAGRFSKCSRFMEKESVENFTCSPDQFDSKVEECNKHEFIFKDKVTTIANEFKIFCDDEWMLSLVGTISSLAQFIGYPIAGFMSDKYGRKTMIALSGTISATMGIIKSFAPNYIIFLIFEFLDGMAGNTLFNCVFVMAVELAVPQNRVLTCSLLSAIYPFGEIYLALVASTTDNWRTLLRVAYTPALLLTLYFWVLPESIRWQLSKSKDDDVTRNLKQAARKNKVHLQERDIFFLLKENSKSISSSQILSSESEFPIRDAFKAIPYRIIVCAFCFFTNVFVFNGLNINSVLLGGNKYTNFMLCALVEVPGVLLPIFTMDRFGRRFSLSGCMVISGLCIAATIFIQRENTSAILFFFLTGKLAISASFSVLMFYSSEIFPTTIRQSLIAISSTAGRIGSLIAPQTTLLAKYFASGPLILFSAAALLMAVFSTGLPETMNTPLPATLEDAKNIGKKKNNVKA